MNILQYFNHFLIFCSHYSCAGNNVGLKTGHHREANFHQSYRLWVCRQNVRSLGSATGTNSSGHRHFVHLPQTVREGAARRRKVSMWLFVGQLRLWLEEARQRAFFRTRSTVSKNKIISSPKKRIFFRLFVWRCISQGRCIPPTCEYGAYRTSHGRCPSKEEKISAARSFHAKWWRWPKTMWSQHHTI